MKKFTLSIVALLLAMPIMAQSTSKDSLLLSKVQRGDKVTERYLVRNADNGTSEFDMLYPINNSTLQSSFSTNADAIAALDRFVEQAADTTMHITKVVVVGYASPDGVESKNMALANARAASVATFVTKQCPKSNVETKAMTYHWADCIPTVEGMNLPDKSQVIAILNSTTHSELEKQAELEKLQNAWIIFKNTILPPMRHSELNVAYSNDKIVERIYTIPQPQPKPQVSTQTVAQTKPQAEQKRYPVAVVETDETGIIVEVPEKEHRHRRKNR